MDRIEIDVITGERKVVELTAEEVAQAQTNYAEWLAAQPNGEEWYDLIYNLDYSNHSIARLLTKHGFKCDWNVVYRFRRKHVSK